MTTGIRGMYISVSQRGPTPQLVITTASPLPNAMVGQAYSQIFGATGGTPPYTWSASAFTPNAGGWGLVNAGGTLAGTPGTAEGESLLVRVQDSTGAAISNPFTFTVDAALVITTASLPNGTVGTAYTASSMAAAGGTGPYTWAILSDSPGSWLTCAPNGVLGGTPTNPETESVQFQVTDFFGRTAVATLPLVVVAGGIVFAPNRPAGMTSLIDRQFAQADLPGNTLPHTDGYGMTWQNEDGPLGPFLGNSAAMLTQTGRTVPTPPDGGGAGNQFLCIQYASGQTIGTAPFIVYWPHLFSTQKIYFCCYVFMPNDFTSNTNNMKWLGIEQHQSGGSANHLFMLSSNGSGVVGSGSSGDYRGPWVTIQGGVNRNLGGSNSDPNSVIQIVPGGGFSSAHLTSPGCWEVMNGRWVMCEWLAGQETNPGVSADGTFDAWVTPMDTGITTHINKWTNVIWNGSGDPDCFNIVTFAPYYGGGGSPAPSAQQLFVGRFQVATL